MGYTGNLPIMTFTGKEGLDLSGSNGAGDEAKGIYADIKNLYSLLSRTPAAGKIPIYDDDGNLPLAIGIGVGAIDFFPCADAPTSYLKANGAIVNREEFEELWTFAKNSGNIVADTDWSSSAMYGSFSYGNGSTTFRIPRLNGYFIRSFDDGVGVDSGRVLGKYQQDQIQNITGRFNVDDESVGYASGAFYRGGVVNGAHGTGAGYLMYFDASRVVRAGTETRGKNVALLACIRYQ